MKFNLRLNASFSGDFPWKVSGFRSKCGREEKKTKRRKQREERDERKEETETKIDTYTQTVRSSRQGKRKC